MLRKKITKRNTIRLAVQVNVTDADKTMTKRDNMRVAAQVNVTDVDKNNDKINENLKH